MINSSLISDPKEFAYLYDLYIVPRWKEPFDALVDAEIKMPAGGRIIELGCGTGGYAIDLAVRLGAVTEILGVDESPERIALARGKAEIKKLENVTFQVGTLEDAGLTGGEFDVVIVDLSLACPLELLERLPDILAGARRLARPDGLLVSKLATRTSFDELYSFYWQALLELGWDEYTEALEDLINERPTTARLEDEFKAAGFKRVASVTSKEEFSFETGEAFLSDPLIANEFLPGWLSILGSEAEAETFKATLASIINRECAGEAFDVSAKMTVITGKR